MPSFLDRIKSSARRRKNKQLRSRRQKRLTIEPLEARQLLATLVVNSAADNLTAGDGLVTLREAVIAANSDGATDLGDTGSGADTIVFDPALDGVPIVLTLGAGSNEDAAAGGDLDITSEITIQGNGAGNTIIDGGSDRASGGSNPGISERVLHVQGSGNLTLDGVTVAGGNANFPQLFGGGLRIETGATATVTNSTISGNFAAGGGGISNYGGIVTVTESTISENLAVSSNQGGGGISNDSGTLTVMESTISGNSVTSVGNGGGISNRNGGTVTVAASTISGNSVGFGGGGGISNGGALSVVNSTISGNSANVQGGGTLNTGTATVTNSTVVANSASLGGGLFNNFNGTTTLNNTIVAGSNAFGGDLAGIFSGTNNLVQDGSGIGLANTIIGDPQLGPLRNNGGLRETHALMAGSPSIDAGSNANATEDGTIGGTTLTSDQRDNPFARIFNTTVDIGAFEAQTTPFPLEVDTAVDEVDGDYSAGDRSLRELIIVANASVGPDTITFDPALNGTDIVLSIAPTGDNGAASGDLNVTSEITIQGNGAASTTIDAGAVGGTDRVFVVRTNANLTLDGVTITGSGIENSFGTLTVTNSSITGNTRTQGNGGGINNFFGTTTVSGSIISGNGSAGDGGGISNSFGTLTVENSTISENFAAGTGQVNGGGGIFNDSGSLTATNSTISGNVSGDSGGGITNRFGVATVTNSTISGNSASSGGGGINQFFSTLRVTNSTISGNSATSGGGGIFILNQADNQVSLLNNAIVAGNTSGGDLFAFISGGHFTGTNNLIQDGSDAGTGLTNTVNGDPLLGPLQNNGGPTETHVPGAGSPAIDAGDNTLAVDGNGNPLTTDQRGFARVADGTVDIGAVENTTVVQIADLSIDKSASFDPIAGTLTYTVTVNNFGPSDAQSVVATDTLPAGVTFVSTAGCNNDPGGVPTCNLGDIPNGGSAQYTIELTVDAGAPDTITNTASVSSATTDPNSSNDTVSIDTTLNAKDPGAPYVDADNDGQFTAGVDVLLDDGELDDGIFDTRNPEGPDYTAIIPGAGLVVTASTGGVTANAIRLRADGDLIVDTDLTATTGDIQLTSNQENVRLDDPTLTSPKKIRVKAMKNFEATDGDVLDAGQRVDVKVGGSIDVSNSTLRAGDLVKLNSTNIAAIGAWIEVTGRNGSADLRASGSMTLTSARIEAQRRISLTAADSIFADLAILNSCGTKGQVRVQSKNLMDLSGANVRAFRRIDISSRLADVNLENSTIGILDGSTAGDIKVNARDNIFLDSAFIRGPDSINLNGTLVDLALADIATGTLPCI